MPKKRQQRSKGDGGLYQIRNKTLWRAVADDGFWPDGRRKQVSATHKTQAGARAKLVEKMDQIKEFGSILDKTTTVRSWGEEWLTTVMLPTLTPAGYTSYQSSVRRHILPVLGNRVVSSLKPSDIRAVIKSIADKGLKSTSSVKAYTVMSRMLEAARLDGLCKKNVVLDVIPPKPQKSKAGSLDTAQVFSILDTADLDIDGSRWWVAILGGLRQGERLGARLSDLDLDAGVFHVEWALTEVRSQHGCGLQVAGVWPCGKKQGAACPSASLMVPPGFEYEQLAGRLCLKRPKSGNPRTVPIPEPTIRRLREYLAKTADDYNPHGLIWHDKGAPITPKIDEQEWRDLLLRAGQIDAEQAKERKDREAGTEEPPPAHTARHTTATVLMELGVDAKIVGEIVGHQSVRMTQRYQHVTSAAASAAMDKLGDHYTKAIEV